MSSTTIQTPGNRLLLLYPTIGYYIGTQEDPVISVRVDDPDLSDHLRSIAQSAEYSSGKLTVYLPDEAVWKGFVEGSGRTPSGYIRARDAASKALCLPTTSFILALGRQNDEGRTPVAAVPRSTARETAQFLADHGIHPDHVKCFHDVPAFVEPARFANLLRETATKPAVPVTAGAALTALLAFAFWPGSAEKDPQPVTTTAEAIQQVELPPVTPAETTPMHRMASAVIEEPVAPWSPAAQLPKARPDVQQESVPAPQERQIQIARFTPEEPVSLPTVTVSTRTAPTGTDLSSEPVGWVAPNRLTSPDLAQAILLKTTVSTLRHDAAHLPEAEPQVRVASVGLMPLPRPSTATEKTDTENTAEAPAPTGVSIEDAAEAMSVRPRKRESAANTDLSKEITAAVAAANATAATATRARPLPRQIRVTASRTPAPQTTFKATANTISVKPTIAPPAPPVKVATAPTPKTQTRRVQERAGLERNKISLVGLYGSKSHRRAILRLPNGRMTKVRPGDSVNGERVAAVGNDSVRLTGARYDTLLRLPD